MGRHTDAAATKLGQSPVERRERRPVTMRGFVMREDGTTAEALMLDLSYEGCGIETPEELQPGEAVKLSVLRRGAIEAHVRWCAGGKAGLVFDPEESESAEHKPRQAERLSLTAEVSLRRLGKLNYRVQVFDISSQGCKVELVDKPRLEEHVLVKFEGLESLEAEVCWIEGTSAGLRFEKPIHPAVFDLLLQRLGA
ncbi:MAG TPA: PilZ domain-containing protein [Sphingomicrobium sp.]